MPSQTPSRLPKGASAASRVPPSNPSNANSRANSRAASQVRKPATSQKSSLKPTPARGGGASSSSSAAASSTNRKRKDELEKGVSAAWEKGKFAKKKLDEDDDMMEIDLDEQDFVGTAATGGAKASSKAGAGSSSSRGGSSASSAAGSSSSSAPWNDPAMGYPGQNSNYGSPELQQQFLDMDGDFDEDSFGFPREKASEKACQKFSKKGGSSAAPGSSLAGGFRIPAGLPIPASYSSSEAFFKSIKPAPGEKDHDVANVGRCLPGTFGFGVVPPRPSEPPDHPRPASPAGTLGTLLRTRTLGVNIPKDPSGKPIKRLQPREARLFYPTAEQWREEFEQHFCKMVEDPATGEKTVFSHKKTVRLPNAWLTPEQLDPGVGKADEIVCHLPFYPTPVDLGGRTRGIPKDDEGVAFSGSFVVWTPACTACGRCTTKLSPASAKAMEKLENDFGEKAVGKIAGDFVMEVAGGGGPGQNKWGNEPYAYPVCRGNISEEDGRMVGYY